MIPPRIDNFSDTVVITVLLVTAPSLGISTRFVKKRLNLELLGDANSLIQNVSIQPMED